MEIKHFPLEKGFDPLSIKNLSLDDLNLLSADIREYILKICASNGGHLASNLGVVELTVALHHFFNLPEDKLIFDVGHQAYAHKILSGRNLSTLRKLDGISGFQKRNESIYDSYEAGHSSTSISAAMGMAVARDLNHDNYNIVAVIGDSSLANGLAFEALNNLASFDHKVIIIINDNNQAISPSVGLTHNLLEKLRLSKNYLKTKERYRKVLTKHKITKPLYTATSGVKNFFKYHLLHTNIFNALGIYYIASVDGHDINAMEKAFKYALNAPKSVIIHVTTTKGKGYKYAEEDKEGKWHGVGPFELETGKTAYLPKPDEISWSQVYSQLLKLSMDEDEKIVLINPATTIGSKLEPIFKAYPNRCFDVGISEEHAITYASGIAISGFHPYVSIYSTFMQRGYDEISHDVARLDLPVTFLVDRAGLVGEDGETHQGIYDTSFLKSIPNVAIAMAKDSKEAEELFEFSRSYKHPLFIRYPRSNTALKSGNTGYENVYLGEWKVEKKGSKAAIISCGPIINDLKDRLYDYEIVNAIFQYPIDIEVLKGLTKFQDIIIYDVYGTDEGLGETVLRALNDLNYQGHVHLLSLPKIFVKQGSIEEQLEFLHRDITSLENYLRRLK